MLTVRMNDILIVCRVKSFCLLNFEIYEGVEILTKEAIDDAEQAAHGADDGRDDIIFPFYLQATVNLGYACPRRFGAQPSGICHSGCYVGGCGAASSPG